MPVSGCLLQAVSIRPCHGLKHKIAPNLQVSAGLACSGSARNARFRRSVRFNQAMPWSETQEHARGLRPSCSHHMPIVKASLQRTLEAGETGTRTSSPMMHDLSTTTRASSHVEGTWCEAHTMAPAVCILNPSNGTHNCRPGRRTCWVQLP